MMPFLWMCSAHAAAPGLLLGVGAEGVTNAIFERDLGGRASVGVEWTPWLQTRVTVAGYPLTGDSRITRISRQIFEENRVTPDLSYPFARGGLSAAFPALRARSGGVSGSVGPELGVGVVYTEDQLDLIDKTDDPEALATVRQWHPTVSYGLVGEMGGRSHGIEARIERMSYRETVDGVEERKNPLWLGIAWVWHPGRSE